MRALCHAHNLSWVVDMDFVLGMCDSGLNSRIIVRTQQPECKSVRWYQAGCLRLMIVPAHICGWLRRAVLCNLSGVPLHLWVNLHIFNLR